MFNEILLLHAAFASLFVLYIIIDRLYIRLFIKEERRESFYKKVKWPMLIICTILIISGKILLIYSFSFYYVLKMILGLFLIFSFFYCPIYMKKEASAFKRFMYRYFVVILTVVVVSLGLYL